MIEFKYDNRKSATNLSKHGIDFDTARGLWLDPALLEVPARTEDEPRFLVVGLIGDTHWSAIITYRGTSIRIISVRHSRIEEEKLYGS